MVQKHIGHGQFDKPATSGSGSSCGGGGASGAQGELLMGDTSSKIGQVFKQMDVRGDGEVCWEDFSSVRQDW